MFGKIAPFLPSIGKTIRRTVFNFCQTLAKLHEICQTLALRGDQGLRSFLAPPSRVKARKSRAPFGVPAKLRFVGCLFAPWTRASALFVAKTENPPLFTLNSSLFTFQLPRGVCAASEAFPCTLLAQWRGNAKERVAFLAKCGLASGRAFW